jgi:hypothetical protein
MTTNDHEQQPPEAKKRSPEALRALAEAEARRKAADAQTGTGDAPGDAKEVGGRKGPDPIRYGDWETDGIASDF